jgi:hypothetical protein
MGWAAYNEQIVTQVVKYIIFIEGVVSDTINSMHPQQGKGKWSNPLKY